VIRWLEELPRQESFWTALENACPAEAAMIWGEAVVLGHGNAGLWVQEGENGPTALLLRNTVGAVTAALLPEADRQELSEFLQVAGFDSLTLPQGWAEQLDLPETTVQEYLLMEWQEQQQALPCEVLTQTITATQLLQNTLAAFGDAITETEQQEWLWAFGLRIRRGTAEAMGLFQHSEMLAAAALSHIGRKGAVIGFVGTSPNKTGKGYGRILTAAMAAQAAGKGLRPLLCCKDELEKVYRRVGFVTIGRQTVLKK